VALFTADRVSKRYLVRPERTARFARRGPARELWALRDLSLDVEPGELVSVIGRNGAGKSTFLKLAAGVATPTEGTLRRPDRVAPLIEVGAGFHPELSGRENVEVNGRLLGLSANQVKRRFDEIVAFADLAHAIDQPVKQYSSGMYMRLGFAVAVQTEPELLIVDEVLAVGDVLFQERCLDRIQAMRDNGTAVLFVSHNLPAVVAISDRALLLESGRELCRGEALDVVREYYDLLLRQPAPGGSGRPDDTGELVIEATRLVDADGRERDVWQPGDAMTVEVDVLANRDTPYGVIGCRVDRQGVGVVAGWGGMDFFPQQRAGERSRLSVDLDLHVAPGDYSLSGVILRADQSAVMVSGVLGRWSVRDDSAYPEIGVAAVHPRVVVS
jgi:ABC-type polysaccharide/polyol phosphate transport system ATPase subunit